MASLNDSLTIGRSGVLTHQERLAIISHNIANVNTPGYHRQTAVLGTNPPNQPGLYSSRAYELGTGVRVLDVTRAYNEMREAVYLSQNSASAMHSQLASALPDLQALVNSNGDASLSTCLRDFWAAWQDVSNNPDSLTMRNVLLERAGTLTERFNIVSARLDEYRTAIARDAGGTPEGALPDAVAEVNSLATRIQNLNARIQVASGTGINANDLEDQRNLLIRELSGKVNITVAADKTITIDTRVLVSGDGVTRNDLTVTGTDPIELTLDGVVISVTGGEVAGWTQLAAITDSLGTGIDTMADELSTQINLLHTAGYDLNATLGVDFFTGAGAAGITVNSALYNPANPLLNQPRLIAAAATIYGPGMPNTGDGAMALAIADLSQVRLPALGDQTLADYFTGVVGTLAASINSEEDLTADGQAVLDTLNNAIQGETGVSLDEEMIDMLACQRAYQASARLVTTIDEMLDTLINQMA